MGAGQGSLSAVWLVVLIKHWCVFGFCLGLAGRLCGLGTVWHQPTAPWQLAQLSSWQEWRSVRTCFYQHMSYVAVGAGRLLVESGTDGSWRVLTRPEQIDELRAALDPRGLRESGLFSALVRVQDDIKAAMPGQPVALPQETGAQLGMWCLPAAL